MTLSSKLYNSHAQPDAGQIPAPSVIPLPLHLPHLYLNDYRIIDEVATGLQKTTHRKDEWLTIPSGTHLPTQVRPEWPLAYRLSVSISNKLLLPF
jgi:hypothetical protein